MYIPCSLHIAEYVILKLRHWLKGIRYILILLDITDHFCGFGTFGKVDEVGAFDDRWDAIFDEG